MRIRVLSARLILLIIIAAAFASCQKEVDGTLLPGFTPPGDQKPKLGTKWVYQYFSYYTSGALRESYKKTYTASLQETFGGKNFLRITDTTGAIIYYLADSSGCLNQYTNSNSYLFFKYPGTTGDTYSTYNAGGPESFSVKTLEDSVVTGLGNIAATYYEGYVGTMLTDKFWYNDKQWIIQQYLYKKPPLGAPYKYSWLILQKITY